MRQPDHLRGTFLGIPDPVKPAWQGYDRKDIEGRPAAVHYDVLRESGFPHDRAREIAHASADRQGYLLDEHRQDRGVPTVGSRHAGGLRRLTPHFGPYAGQLCRVLPDGSLQPVEGAP